MQKIVPIAFFLGLLSLLACRTNWIQPERSLLYVSQNEEILTKSHLPFYSEANTFSRDSLFILRQSLLYNRMFVYDEEYWHSLEITFNDSAVALKKSSFKIPEDSLLVKCFYDEGSVWDWHHEENLISGDLEILRWKRNRITLKLNLVVYEPGTKQTKVYKGKRTFFRR